MAKVITNNIRKLRFEHQEMTQQKLADSVSVSRQTIIAIEKGKYSPSLEVAFKIADIFEQPINQVFIYQEQR
ncbi:MULTISPECIES: helix-turn-helix transcriptional regulator [unclassified Colwellia]|uniref:helix-turn-helix transcriptional regulator n=1 Tax=unclassified Colwellia TaxID=196834 RepID=UPI0015F47A88|nr:MULTISPECIES: helix-turn-helix transcriptional regulator [unclassified Colwellia]MBA6356076.1 helix-turn-helix transcriptional regulator [Colwellia sp. BRX8-3]MBA6358643.1 helix-turn-helix transcriptional regulator [Colwellia sp. BRX8-6]MBA6366706.1 helix-turn-helix transcriptional regulator [Colwellia sp. BRX8-5]MBA6375182.1 helix-turn-helix transcriptional regulator [Colwellia sp. BRX8-2]